jgi:argininosuccinate lyase
VTKKTKTERLESSGRLKAKAAAELIQSANQLEISYGSLLFRGMSLADLAHVAMLSEAGIIPKAPARRLLAVLLEVHKMPVADFVFDPALGDAYKNREHRLVLMAPEAAGWLRTGRARREATNIAYQIAVRERILSLVDALLDLSEALVELAAKHTDTIMPDLTYLQHAQPTSLAHYLLSFVYPILRDFERLQACFHRVNLCSGGIASVNGSRLPFKRQRLAELLGFQGAITHTRDAMWQADMPVEIMAGLVAAIISIDRLGEDLQVWVTQEFDLVDLADGYCRESVIMPQKKNPYSLAFIRGAAGVLIGHMTAMANVGKTMSGQPDSRIFAYGDVPRSLDLAIQTVRLMAGVIRTMSVNMKVMAKRAAEGYSQATDLAEIIMLETGLHYLAAHRLVGEIVAVASQLQVPASHISNKMINTVAKRILGYSLKLPARQLSRELHPRKIVATRTGLGGAAREPLLAMIAETRAAVCKVRQWQTQTEKQLFDAEANLIKFAHELRGTIGKN